MHLTCQAASGKSLNYIFAVASDDTVHHRARTLLTLTATPTANYVSEVLFTQHSVLVDRAVIAQLERPKIKSQSNQEPFWPDLPKVLCVRL